MIDLNVSHPPAQPQQPSQIEQGIEACRELENRRLDGVGFLMMRVEHLR